MVTIDKPMRKPTPATLPSCVFCGGLMATPDTVAGAPIHPDCFTRLCVATFVEDVPAWRWIPFQGWAFDADADPAGDVSHD